MIFEISAHVQLKSNLEQGQDQQQKSKTGIQISSPIFARFEEERPGKICKLFQAIKEHVEQEHQEKESVKITVESVSDVRFSKITKNKPIKEEMATEPGQYRMKFTDIEVTSYAFTIHCTIDGQAKMKNTILAEDIGDTKFGLCDIWENLKEVAEDREGGNFDSIVYLRIHLIDEEKQRIKFEFT